ncbi:MAG: DUF1464 family protein [Nitrososphaerales archaeon]|jgi:predicted butyrate kinase (DUF1464 family)|nr:DUF1464 family protein [Nitrososphaerales archaeon]|tara:strand:- start:9249 stop:10418 length:1170 start_codon:yes stop_codon:yes gene_type:complete
MVKAIGIDPGTKSIDIFGFDDETKKILIDKTILRDEFTKNPKIVLDVLRNLTKSTGKLDVIVGPSGYGITPKRASETEDSEILMATFVSESDIKRRLRILGIRELMFLMKKASDLNIWFTPGVIHLPTVPRFRKAGKIDMGTADKLFSVIIAMKDQAETLKIKYSETSFILIEIGFAYTSAMAVEKGALVDGIGGTTGNMGYLGMGTMDGELAYAISNSLQDYSRLLLFSGGVSSLAGIDPFSIDIKDFIRKTKVNKKTESAYEAFQEGIIKNVFSLIVSMKELPKEILLSGRFLGISTFRKDIISMLNKRTKPLSINEIRTVKKQSANVKEAAQGSAILANGIAGGKYKPIVENLKIFESEGTIFDHIYLDKSIVEKIKETFTKNNQL